MAYARTQPNWFSNGGFVLHRVYTETSNCKISLWYDPHGMLSDGERITKDGRSLPLTDKLRKEFLLASCWFGTAHNFSHAQTIAMEQLRQARK